MIVFDFSSLSHPSFSALFEYQGPDLLVSIPLAELGLTLLPASCRAHFIFCCCLLRHRPSVLRRRAVPSRVPHPTIEAFASISGSYSCGLWPGSAKEGKMIILSPVWLSSRSCKCVSKLAVLCCQFSF